MNEKTSDQFGIKFWVISACVVIVIAGMKVAGEILIPFFLALVISAICIQPFVWLKKRGLPEWLIVTILTLIILFISILTLLIIGTSISGFVEKAPEYGNKFSLYYENINKWLVHKGLIEPDSVLLKDVNPKSVMTLLGSLFTAIGNLMSSAFIILLIIIFLLLEVSLMNKKIKAIKPESVLSITAIINSINKYFSTKTTLSLATGIFITSGLMIIGVDFAILWGFLAFLLNFIPNIGSIIAAVPAVLIALVQLGPAPAVFTAILYIVVNTIIGNVIEPKLMGKNLGLSVLVVFLSLIFWGWVLGTVGMLLAVPLTMTIKLIFDQMDELKWLGLLLGDESSLSHFKKSE